MLEEITGMFLSLFSLFVNETPRVSLREPIDATSDTEKFVAVMVPGLTIIPAAICKHMALRRSSEVVDPGRSFVLVYFIRGGVILLYRTITE